MVKLITAHSFHLCTKSTKSAVLFEITYGGGEFLYVQSANFIDVFIRGIWCYVYLSLLVLLLLSFMSGCFVSKLSPDGPLRYRNMAIASQLRCTTALACV